MQYATIEKTATGIKIKLTEEAKADLTIEDDGEVYNYLGRKMLIDDILEDNFGNGWTLVPPEDVGGLTSAPLLTDDCDRSDDGKIINVGNIYWFPNYQIENEVKTLVLTGEVFFHLAPSYTESEAA